MKINISVDITPEEFRKLMGWPDVQELNTEIIDKMREQIASGAEGYDPLSLMQPYINQSFESMGGFQKMMAKMMENYWSPNKKEED